MNHENTEFIYKTIKALSLVQKVPLDCRHQSKIQFVCLTSSVVSECKIGQCKDGDINIQQISGNNNLLLAWSMNLRSASLRVDSTPFPVQSTEWNNPQSEFAHCWLQKMEGKSVNHIETTKPTCTSRGLQRSIYVYAFKYHLAHI